MNKGYEQRKLLKKEGLKELEIDNELILSDPGTGRIHILNKTSRLIWSLADGIHTVKEIEDKIKEQFYSVKDHDVRHDIERFIEELTEKELLR